MNYWFISDTHLGHENIIKYCKRPFASLIEMDEAIIKNWNTRVKKDDVVFHLGDFCFRKSGEAPGSQKKAFEYYMSKLNGDIILIQGNHEKSNVGNKSIIESMVIKYGGKRIYLTHDPKYSKKEFELNFTGHVHNNEPVCRKLSLNSTIVNLCVEHWNYSPISINEIYSEVAKWKNGDTKEVTKK